MNRFLAGFLAGMSVACLALYLIGSVVAPEWGEDYTSEEG